MNTSKWLCAGLVAVFAWGALGGPAAMAQTQAPPAGAMPAPITTPPYEPTQGDRVGAGVLNVVYVPGKAIVCGAGVVAGGLLMLLTFGSAYQQTVAFFNEGCGGKWTLSPYDVAGRRPPETVGY